MAIRFSVAYRVCLSRALRFWRIFRCLFCFFVAQINVLKLVNAFIFAPNWLRAAVRAGFKPPSRCNKKYELLLFEASTTTRRG